MGTSEQHKHTTIDGIVPRILTENANTMNEPLPSLCKEYLGNLDELLYVVVGNWRMSQSDWCFTARQHKIGQFVPIYQAQPF